MIRRIAGARRLRWRIGALLVAILVDGAARVVATEAAGAPVTEAVPAPTTEAAPATPLAVPSVPTPAPAAAAAAERITLSADDAARAGIVVGPVAAAEAADEIEAFGRVLDPLPLLEAWHARRAARSALTVARAEYDRVERLHRDDRNASTRDLESARATLERATLELADASARVALAWGALDAEALTDDLVSGRAALVRVDIPAAAHLESPPATVDVAVIGSPARRFEARVLGRAPTVDPLLQGDAYLALVRETPPPPGTALTATLARAPTPRAGVTVPAAAVLWADGQPLVYVEVSPGAFERRVVRLGPRRGDAWLVTDGVAADDHVVAAGAAQLLSTELLRAQPGGD